MSVAGLKSLASFPKSVFDRFRGWLLDEPGAFTGLQNQAYRDAAELLRRAPITVWGQLDLTAAGNKRPGATWTYLVIDDVFGSEWERVGRFVKNQFLQYLHRPRPDPDPNR